MESTVSEWSVLLQKELPFGVKILSQHLGELSEYIETDSLYISRQEFLKLLEINVNKK